MPGIKQSEWRRLYARLRPLLTKHGKESPYGDGDFWLVDDDWGGELHKICVSNIRFLSRDVVKEIQNLLKTEFPSWGVMCQLEITNAKLRVPPEGIVIYGDRVEEAWDPSMLRNVLGDAFRW